MDYSGFDPKDPKARLRENLAFRLLERDRINQVIDARTAIFSGLLSAFPQSKEHAQFASKVLEQAEQNVKSLRNGLLPWIDWLSEEHDKIEDNSGKDLHRRWEAFFGSLNSPETQKKLDFYRAISKKLGRPSST